MNRGKNKTVSYGYVGRWSDGTIGWCLPHYANGQRASKPEIPSLDQYPSATGDFFYKCKITVEVLKNKKGKPIRRKLKPRP